MKIIKFEEKESPKLIKEAEGKGESVCQPLAWREIINRIDSPLESRKKTRTRGGNVISDFTCCFSHRSHASDNLYREEGYLPTTRHHLFEKHTSTPIVHSRRAQQRVSEPVDGRIGMQVLASNDLGVARAVRAFL